MPPARTGRGSLPHPPRPTVPVVPIASEGPVKGLGIRPRQSSTAQDQEHQDVPTVKPRQPLSTLVDDSVSETIHKLIEEAVANVRNELMEELEKEKKEVASLRAELDELRNRLDL
jgi:hypothetical protein